MTIGYLTHDCPPEYLMIRVQEVTGIGYRVVSIQCAKCAATLSAAVDDHIGVVLRPVNHHSAAHFDSRTD